MGGFVDKDLYTKIGDLISYFDVQCYDEYSLIYLINEKWLSNEKIVMGMLTGQDFNLVINELKNCSMIKIWAVLPLGNILMHLLLQHLSLCMV